MTVAHTIDAQETLRQLRTVSWEDYLRFEDPPGYRSEYEEGALLMTPTAVPLHDRVRQRLSALLEQYDYAHDYGRSLTFSEHSFFMPAGLRDYRPDVAVVTDSRKDTWDPDDGSYFEGAPNIAVEVLSPSTEAMDRGLKATRYYEHGAGEYWLLDPRSSSAEFFRRSPEGWIRVPLGGEEPYTTPLLPGFELDIAELFRRARAGR